MRYLLYKDKKNWGKMTCVAILAGFFAGFYLVSISLLQVALFWTSGQRIFGNLPYKLVIGVASLAGSIIFWYISSRRNLKSDAKGTMAAVLLSVFRFRRAIVSAEESGTLAKLVVFSPYYLARGVFLILKFIGRETAAGLFDFLIALGVKKLK